MTSSSRRLPTSALVVFTVVVVATGALWWSRAAPAVARPAPPAGTGSPLFVQLQNGAVLAFPVTSATGFTGSPRQLDSLAKLTSAQWPCRVEQSGRRRPFDLMGDGLEALPRTGDRALRLPTCGGPARTRR